MPPDTVYVGRGSPWGNPFEIGKFGTRKDCVHFFTRLLHGFLVISCPTELYRRQKDYLVHLQAHIGELRGKNLACWCRMDQECHADWLLVMANVEDTSC